MFTSQNSQGLNRAILRLLWLMTSAAADVISVPSVNQGVISLMFHKLSKIISQKKIYDARNHIYGYAKHVHSSSEAWVVLRKRP